MQPPVVRLHSVCKSFAGRTVVDRLDFEVRRGEVFALLGPNGAGKTTTVRMLVGIIRPDSGRIEVKLGAAATNALPPESTSYLPEDRGLYRELPVLRTLVYFGMLRGLERQVARNRAREWLERMGLGDRQNERLDALSKGNQQRVQLIAAFLHRPALAVLDEPFSGLDPLSQEFFLELVRELKQAGTTILLSAHQMDLVERAADRILLLNRGREILSGSLRDLHAQLDPRPRLRLAVEAGADLGALRVDPDIEESSATEEGLHIVLRRDVTIPQFLARAVTEVPIRNISTETARLHDVFVRAIRNDDATTGERAT